MSNYNNETKKPTNPLDETIICGEMIPLAFSTELKNKNSRKFSENKLNIEYSFTQLEHIKGGKVDCNSIDYENKSQDNLTQCNYSILKQVGKESECDIPARYLVKHERPLFKSTSFVAEPKFIEEKTPLREANIEQPNSQDISAFRRFSNSISDFNFSPPKLPLIDNKPFHNKETVQYFTDRNSIFNKNDTYDACDENNDDTVFIINKARAQLDANDTNVSGFDELIEDLTLSGSLNMTKLASEMKSSEIKKANRQRAELIIESKEQPIAVESVMLLSNKSYILWIGVPVQICENKRKHEAIYDWLYRNNLIKSFTLNLRSSSSQQVNIKIKKNTGCFYLTNQQGQDHSNNITVTFEPKIDRKLYVAFHPTNSNYHTDVLIISVGNRKFKINLFGYAEPAIVELKGFHLIDDPVKPGKESLMKRCSRRAGQSKFTVSVFNSGARTAFVALFSHHNNVRFQPRMFLLIPKTKMEFDITVKMTADTTTVDFFIINVDEELRRAARISFSEFPSNDMYNIFNHVQIFSRLPEEKTIRQDDLPKFDWRPYLCRQINSSYRLCYLNFDNVNDNDDNGVSSTVDRWANDSVSTIGMVSRSSMTGPSALSNVECLYSKSVYVNSVESFVNSLNQTLSSIVILKDFNNFTPTCVKKTNYCGILIRNNNQFPVYWLVSDMLSVCHEETLLDNNNHYDNDLIIMKDKSGDSSSIYSLTSIPIYNPAQSMVVLDKEGSLLPNQSIVVPVKFSPENTGLTNCRCHFKVFTKLNNNNKNDNNGGGDGDAVFEKDLEFSALTVRHSQTSRLQPEIPGLSVEGQLETTFELCGGDGGGGGGGEPRRLQLKMVVNNKSRYTMEIFTNRLSPPFEPFKMNTVCLPERRSMLCVNCRPSHRGTFTDVLLLADQDGNSTFVNLIVHVK